MLTKSSRNNYPFYSNTRHYKRCLISVMNYRKNKKRNESRVVRRLTNLPLWCPLSMDNDTLVTPQYLLSSPWFWSRHGTLGLRRNPPRRQILLGVGPTVPVLGDLDRRYRGTVGPTVHVWGPDHCRVCHGLSGPPSLGSPAVPRRVLSKFVTSCGFLTTLGSPK